MRVPELSTQEALITIDEICHLGVPFFHFSGGEPMLREDLPLLAKRASSYGCLVGMSTNGTLFTSFNVPRIAKSFDVISISLDGPREVHDEHRGMEGAFDKAVGAIGSLKAEGVRVGVNTIVASWNIETIPGFIERLYGLVDFATLQPIHPYPPPPSNSPSAKAVFDLVQYLIEFKRKHPGFLAVPTDFVKGFEMFFDGRCPKICHAGELYVGIDPKGRLLACGARDDIVLGNALEHSAVDILNERMKNREWGKVTRCKGCWLGCTTQSSMLIQKLLQKAVSLSGARDFNFLLAGALGIYRSRVFEKHRKLKEYGTQRHDAQTTPLLTCNLLSDK